MDLKVLIPMRPRQKGPECAPRCIWKCLERLPHFPTGSHPMWVEDYLWGWYALPQGREGSETEGGDTWCLKSGELSLNQTEATRCHTGTWPMVFNDIHMCGLPILLALARIQWCSIIYICIYVYYIYIYIYIYILTHIIYVHHYYGIYYHYYYCTWCRGGFNKQSLAACRNKESMSCNKTQPPPLGTTVLWGRREC